MRIKRFSDENWKPSTHNPVEPNDGKWDQAWHTDPDYQEAVRCLQQGASRFPPHLRLKVSVSECQVNANGSKTFRTRQWVPDHEPLRTKLVETAAHASPLVGHSGRERNLCSVEP